MEQQNTAKEKILKKVRKALLEPTENPYNNADFESELFENKEELDICFAQMFSENKGYFIYCQDPKDFTLQLHNLIQQEGWDKIKIMDDDLQNLFEKTGFDNYELVTESNSSLANLSLCEGLIARTGSIIISSKQKESNAFHYQTQNLLFVASVKHITSNIELAIEQIKEKYSGMPENLSIISGVDQLKNHFKDEGPGLFGPKAIYLFLIDK